MMEGWAGAELRQGGHVDSWPRSAWWRASGISCVWLRLWRHQPPSAASSECTDVPARLWRRASGSQLAVGNWQAIRVQGEWAGHNNGQEQDEQEGRDWRDWSTFEFYSIPIIVIFFLFFFSCALPSALDCSL